MQMPFRYPIALELSGRRCVVVGGGEVGEHKARSLVNAGGTVVVIAENFTQGLEDIARLGEVKLVRKSYSYGDLEGAFLAIAATEDKGVNAEIFKEAEERQVLLNAVDDNEHCHFAVPSIVRRGDFLLAISTGGKAPALAKRLRISLGKEFGTEYGDLVELLGEVRQEALAQREVEFDTWARWWQVALDQDLLSLVREGRIGLARQVVRRALTQGKASPDLTAAERLNGARTRKPSERGPAARVWIVGAGPGDPGLIPVRAREALDGADVVVYDRLVHPSLIQGKDAIYVGKESSDHPVPQAEINALLIRLAREGKRVVRLKGGDPFVFGRGSEEAEALAEAGITFEVIPAPTSAIAALAYAGIPVTDRRFSSSVAFVTGHCARGEVDWKRLATAVDTIVVLMGLSSLPEIAGGLAEGGLDPATPGAIVENGTLPSQRVVIAPLSDLASAAAEAGIKSPAVIVIGEVVRLRERIAWFKELGVQLEAQQVVGS
jgi:uroporphyrin-III C-methyltransferase/precorrin-2 dehydrogenase/sirohydrochlorin ferrochelatase